MTSPTKPISPLTDTTAAVPSVAVTTMTSLDRDTDIPSVAASTSPMRNTSSCRRCRISTIELMITYGAIRATSDHVAPDSRPSTHWNTSRITSLWRCRMNVCIAVANDTTAMPASTSVVPEREPPADEPTT